MRSRAFAAIVLACASFNFSSLIAAPSKPDLGPATPQQLADGEALAERLRSAGPQENSEIRGKLIIKPDGAPSWEIPIVCEVTRTETNWQTEYDTTATDRCGAQRLLVIHSTNGPNQYFYAQASTPSAPLPKPSALAPSDTAIPLAGSDFSLADLSLEFLHWPVQRQLKGEMRLGQPCFVLESSNLQKEGIVRVKSYIDKESGGPLIADGFDAGGHLVKEYSLHGSGLKKINGRWQVEKLDIRDRKTSSHTELKFDLKE